MNITGYSVWTISEVDGDVTVTDFAADEHDDAVEYAGLFVDSMVLPVVDVVIYV